VHQAAIPSTVTVHEEHHGKKLVLRPVPSLLSFGISGDIRIGGNLFKNDLGAVGVSADVAAQPLCVGN
jgi:hypothetical protein